MIKIFKNIWSLIDKSQRSRIIYLFFIFIGIIFFEVLSIGLIIPLLTLIFEGDSFLKKLNIFL